ncbi:hypothetical protein [Spiroplasma endosymbiont of Aleiodes alternator]|uniref:hypothetical protein n=1 Tax=Spiroplasma endosymbiont of Aleiodes alternator TaxID=3139329 RepID=UPI003CCB6E60
MDLGLWISFGIIGAVIWIVLIRYGIKYCLKNNAMGVVILFITLNIFGLVLGWAILWNLNCKYKWDKWTCQEKWTIKVTFY